MTSNNTNRFLDLEEAADGLIRQLQALEGNVKSYSEVGSDLARASQGLSEATAQYVDVAAQMKAVATAMRDIGMPGLLNAVEEATSAVRASQAQASAGFDGLLDAVRQAQDAVEQAQQQTIDGLREAVRQAQEQTSSSLSVLLNAVGQIEANQRRDAMQIKLVVVAGFVLAAAAGVVASLI